MSQDILPINKILKSTKRRIIVTQVLLFPMDELFIFPSSQLMAFSQPKEEKNEEKKKSSKLKIEDIYSEREPVWRRLRKKGKLPWLSLNRVVTSTRLCRYCRQSNEFVYVGPYYHCDSSFHTFICTSCHFRMIYPEMDTWKMQSEFISYYNKHTTAINLKKEMKAPATKPEPVVRSNRRKINIIVRFPRRKEKKSKAEQVKEQPRVEDVKVNPELKPEVKIEEKPQPVVEVKAEEGHSEAAAEVQVQIGNLFSEFRSKKQLKREAKIKARQEKQELEKLKKREKIRKKILKQREDEKKKVQKKRMRDEKKFKKYEQGAKDIFYRIR